MKSQTDPVKEKTLKYLFEPRSVAVIGASRREEAVGYAILHNLITAGFRGRIYPVNPKSTEICGLPCYPSLAAIPDSVDLAVIIVPNTSVPEAMELCAHKNVSAAIVISAGFREIGPEGAQLEKQVLEIAAKSKIPVLGPNCLGLINTDSEVSMNASFSRTMPKRGNIAFVSQSGALCTAILDYAKGKKIGFSKFISLGNKAEITELDILRYLKDDPQTSVILMYVEDLAHGRAFIEMAREITGEISPAKPILAIKAGRTLQGAKAASSHTGSLMGSDSVYDAIFAQAGVLRVDSVDEMFNYGIGFANQPIPKGNRVAIITNAGGPGIMATDACVRHGLEMAVLSAETEAQLKKVLPLTANWHNPIDVIGDAQHGRYRDALKIVAADPGVDSMIVILTPQAMTDIEDIARVVVEVDQSTDKTLLACFMGIVDVSAGVAILEENFVPHYTFPEDAARTLGAMNRYRQWMDRPRTPVKQFSINKAAADAILNEARDRGENYLTIDQSMALMKAYGFPVLPSAVARSVKEASQKAAEIGFPVAMKIISKKIVHKFDLGGVKLKLMDETMVADAYEEMMAKLYTSVAPSEIEGVFIQAMARQGREVILGMTRDPKFGPTLMFGLGGIYVEALKDVTFRLAPIREFGARRMIESIKAYALLKGMRGESPADFEMIMECLERLSQLACDHPEIGEIDINPLMVYRQGDGAGVVDARILLS